MFIPGTQSITAVLGGAPATSNPTFLTACVVEATQKSVHGTLSAVAATVVPTTTQGMTRITFLQVNNSDTVSITLTLTLVDGGNSYQLWSGTLSPGDTLQYLPATGWRVVDSLGRIKTVSTATSNQDAPTATPTYAASMTIDVSKAVHVVSAASGTSATCTMTPSAAGSPGQRLTIITEADASGTVTTTYASTFHSSGTQATTASHFSSITFMSDGTRWIEVGRVTALS